MWNHSECSAATSAMPARSSTIPALVVPAVPTTADHVPAAGVVPQRRPQRRTGEPMIPRRHRERADAEDMEGLAHRGVGVLADGDERAQRRNAVAPVRRGVAGDHERRQVAGGAARHEAAAGLLREPRLRREDAQRLVLGHHHPGRLEPRGSVQRRARDEHVEEEGGLGRRGRDERQEARAVARHHRRRELVDEELQHLGGVRSLRRHEAGELGIERGDEATEVEGHRIHRQALPAGREDQVCHRLVVVEHRARHQTRGSPDPG